MVAKTTSALSFLLAITSSSSFTPTTHINTISSPPYYTTTTSLNAKKKIFIDGEAGTTGLQVRDRLAKRSDLEIISISNELRKDKDERKRLINEADCVILCKCFVCIMSKFMHSLYVLTSYAHNILQACQMTHRKKPQILLRMIIQLLLMHQLLTVSMMIGHMVSLNYVHHKRRIFKQVNVYQIQDVILPVLLH